MIVPVESLPNPVVEYPDSDGNPMADNTQQFQWIVTLQGNLDDLFRDNPDVFVAGDLLWYPVEGDNKIRVAPDAMVVFGRPKGFRGSYQQWLENGIAPQVVFEVLSPGNTPSEMVRKRLFYETYGVDEFYIYDPEDVVMSGFRRDNTGTFVVIPQLNGFRSPLLGIQFDLTGEELVIRRRDGTRFFTFLEICDRVKTVAKQAKQATNRANREAKRATESDRRADEETKRATESDRRADEEARRAAEADQRAAEEAKRAKELEQELLQLREQLRQAGIDPGASRM